MSEYRKLSRPSSEADENISRALASKVKELFPVSGNFFSLGVSNVSITKGQGDINNVKTSLVNGSTISNKVSALVTLTDKATGKVIDSKRRVVMSVPAFTSKGSFVIEGNSYVIPFQQRLRTGVYTQKKRNGVIETMFNLGKGRNFTIKLNTDKFAVKVGSAHVSLYSILKFIDTSDAEIKKAWGEELFDVNSKTYNSKDAEKFMTLFSYGHEAGESKNIRDDIKEAISTAEVSPSVVKETLGIEASTVTPEMLLKASVKLLAVSKGDKEPDDRENMMFKQVVTPERMMSEAFDKGSREIISKIKFKLSSPNTSSVDEVLGGGGVMLGRAVKTFVVSSSSSIMPEEYNPMMMHMANHLITPLGDGGVGDTRALNLDTKAVHGSHLGFIDPIVSPEGASVGITLAVTGNSYVDEEGTPAMKVINARTGEEEVVPLDVLWKSKLSYPVSKDRLENEGVMVRVGNKDVPAKKKSDIDYMMIKSSDMHAPSTNLVALMNSMDANRGNMAQKHIQQALSLTEREEPNVSVSDGEDDMAATIAKESGHIPFTKNGGVVTKITEEIVTVKAEDGSVEKIHYVKDMPLARKTFINHELSVKVGDVLAKGQHLADSNFTKNGKMALGKNIRTAWLSMRGNRNDGIVISDVAAEMFTSEHMYKENISLDAGDILDFSRFKQLFPKEVAKWGASNYDSRGIIKKGKKLRNHQPMVFMLKKADAKSIKSKMEKVMFSPYKAKIVEWHHEDEGEVIEMKGMGSEIRLNIKVKSPMKVGDKMAGRFGNKGVITRIDAEDDMPKDKQGNPLHATMTAAGVISRTNGGSLIEAGLGKIADKTGKRYVMEHYAEKDNLEYMEKEAKKHGVDVYETIIDPKTGKPFPSKVFVGKPFMMKLFKDGESGMASVGVGSTDVNGQPTKGGSRSAASYSNMEANALLAHGAKSLLSEAKHVKSQKNDEFFDAFRRGIPLPPPAENFASAKFRAYLEQMSVDVRVDKNTSEYSMISMTDKEIVKKSSGKLRNSDTIFAKNGKPVKGGLFDDTIFGGPEGKRSSHIDLGTKILNPLYKDHVARLLGVSEAKLLDKIKEEGVDSVIKSISKISPEKEVKLLKNDIIKSSNPQVANRNIKSIKMLEKVISSKQKLEQVAFLSKVPVIAPVYRPATKDGNGDISINDLNLHYQDIFSMSEAITKSKGLNKKTVLSLKSDLYQSVGAMYGVEESPNKKIRDKKIKGVLDILGGDTPKMSYSQQNLLRIKQFMSGRAVIVPARRDISIDQIEIPEAMGLEMYEPHISRKMSRMGLSAVETQELIEKKDPRVIKALHDLGKNIPLAYNRAPTLWKHGILGGYPIFTKGSVIGVNPLSESALGSDYDGDQIAVHVPISKEAIDDIKDKMMPSQNLFNDRLSHISPSLLQLPDQDATLGIYKASIGKKVKPIKIKSVSMLKEEIRKGNIKYSDYVKVG